MSLFRLVFRAGCGIRLYRFLITAFLSTCCLSAGCFWCLWLLCFAGYIGWCGSVGGGGGACFPHLLYDVCGCNVARIATVVVCSKRGACCLPRLLVKRFVSTLFGVEPHWWSLIQKGVSGTRALIYTKCGIVMFYFKLCRITVPFFALFIISKQLNNTAGVISSAVWSRCENGVD